MGGLVAVVGVMALFTLEDSPTLHPKRDEKGFWHQFLTVFNWETVRGIKSCSGFSGDDGVLYRI